jgi:hypothetical protein
VTVSDDGTTATVTQTGETIHFPGAIPEESAQGRSRIFIPRVTPPLFPGMPPRVVIAPRPRTGKGAVIGAVVGVGFGAIVGYVAPLTHLQRHDGAVLGAFAFGGLGGFVGHQFDF